MRYAAHKNLFIKKILKSFGVWIDFTLTRFDQKACSMQQRTESVYAESNGIFGNFLRRLLKIYIQIKWMCQLKKDSLASLVHNIFFAFSLWLRIAYFFTESNSIVENFLGPLSKICIQIKYIVLNKNMNRQTNVGGMLHVHRVC